MDGSHMGSRLTPMGIAAALVVAGVLVVGLSACGSGSSSDSTGSASVAKKEAGGRGISFNVVNQDQAGIKVTICGDGNCQPSQQLQPGESVTASAGSVDGSIVFPQNGDQVQFRAENPFIGQPYIQLGSPGSGGRQELALSEGEARTTALDGYRFTASRASDTDDYKRLALEVGG